jgi:hypothetical protein
MPFFAARMVDIFPRQVEFVFMALWGATDSVPRSVKTEISGMACCSKNGRTRSFKSSAAVTGV